MFFWGIHKFHLFAQFRADFLCIFYIVSCVKKEKPVPKFGFLFGIPVFSAVLRMNIRFFGKLHMHFSFSGGTVILHRILSKQDGCTIACRIYNLDINPPRSASFNEQYTKGPVLIEVGAASGPLLCT